MHRSHIIWLAVGWAGYALLPWYAYPPRGGTELSVPLSALALGLLDGRSWLLVLALPLLLPLLAIRDGRRAGDLLVLSGGFGFAYVLAQGFALNHRGWGFSFFENLFGATEATQPGLGLGALVTLAALLFLLTGGLAAKGAMKGDRFTTGAIGLVIASILIFVFLPVFYVLAGAAQAPEGQSALLTFIQRLSSPDIWSLGCLGGGTRCGVAWTSLFLAVLTGTTTTLLGLAFALVAVRTGFRFKRSLRLLTVLPIITPPFVIGLALILLFGRNGTVTLALNDWFDLGLSRWIYGLPGILLAQTLAFTPISFLVMIGVVQGISPSMEEASQTLRASRWHTFRRVTWPLLRPGLANAFLIGFIESLADFGNPLVLGGNYEVLSTRIFYAVVGAQVDPGRAAALAVVLLALCIGAFWLQRSWLGKKSYTTLGGKGDSGVPAELPKGVRWLVFGTAIPWATFTFVLYALILVGGFVENWGRNNALTLRHYLSGFSVEWTEHGILWSGRAWNSFFTTMQIATISAPLTAGIGLLTAYLLVRQRFAGKGAFEFMTMMSFAIPGTVIGVSYILAFNAPPIELTGTAVILVICFIFRNMPVSIRAGVAAMSQIDRSLDECALTLRSSSARTVRRVIVPLLRPAIVAALVYSFVRAITSVSAVVFLVSARHDLATSYIVGRVEAGDFGLAIAYSSVLIVFMGLVITLIQLVVGERRVGRRASKAATRAARIQEVPA